jgi:hypothetical protein
MRSNLEGWPNAAARVAGWRRVTQPAGCDFVLDGRSMPPALADHTICPVLGLIYCIAECTQNTVMSYVTRRWHGQVLQ